MQIVARIEGLSAAIEGYGSADIKLELFVDDHGYQPVMHDLVTLSQSQSISVLNSPTPDFLKSLSPKSQGLMLTSALISGNEALYAPLYSQVFPVLTEMYSQDLPSLLGGDQAPLALSEMTRRTSKSISTLESYGRGLTNIAGLKSTSSQLDAVKAEITSSAWVEKHSEQSQGLMSLVKAAPSSVDAGPLKTGALARYLNAGLKIAGIATVLAGVGIAGLYGASFANKAGGISFVDLDSRPVIETMVKKDVYEKKRVIKYGEIADLSMATHYAKFETNRSIPSAIKRFSQKYVDGLSLLIKAGDFTDQDVCMVTDHQVGKVSQDGNFYMFPGSISVTDKNLTDFWVSSHEVTHCFAYYDLTNGGIKEISGYEDVYGTSLNEVSADLGSILDYMQETGNDKIYSDFLRPMRISSVEDYSHKTAWALDIILKDVDVHAIQMKPKEEIPKIVEHLMQKHFMNADGTFSPGRITREGKTGINTPAANAIAAEIMAARSMSNERSPELRDKLKADIESTISIQHSKYQGVAQAEVLHAAGKAYDGLIKDFSFKPLEKNEVQKAKVSKHLDSMISLYL